MIKTVDLPLKTNVYHKTAYSTAPLLVFIPGNPGFIQYYTRYLDVLFELTGFEILGISHAGFCKEDPSDKIYSLEDQIQHKIDILETFVKKDREIYIMGHSVGSWIIQRIIDRTKYNYKFIGLITPTIIDIHKSRKGSFLFPIVSRVSFFYKIIGSFSRALSYLPKSIVNYLIVKFINTEFQGAKDITKELILNHRFVEQSLALATEEMLTIQSDWEYQKNFQTFNKNINKWYFLTSPDHWVSDETQKLLEISIENDDSVLFTRDNNLKHSFCISQSELFADITNEAINHYS